MVFTSASGFLYQSIRCIKVSEDLVETLDEARTEDCRGGFFLFQGYVWQLSKSENFYLFDSQSRDLFARVSKQETDVLPKFSCIKSVFTYIFDT